MRVLLAVALLASWQRYCEVKHITFDHQTLPASVILKEGQRFDYIVVGAGAAGAAVASRLTLSGASVLLVEAGGDPSELSKIPAAAMALLGSDLDWKYKTIPNNVSCLSSRGQQCRFSRGKCFGGSTSINYMMYTRGNRRDFDDIPVPGWSWDDLMPYFLRYEGQQDLDLLPATSVPYHNTSGTMRIGFFNDSENPWHSRLRRSFQSLGFPENPDVNAASQIGVSKIIGYVYKGKRMSTARGYLAREDIKRSLYVAKNTLCTGVIINKKNVVRGITAEQGLQKLKVYARREVILSAGAIGTPQILMLSGIGPADHLESLGISVKVNLNNVGANMTDHVLPLLLVLVDKNTGIVKDLRDLSVRGEQLVQLLVDRSGALTSIGLTDVTAFANSHCYDFERRKLLNESTDGSDCEFPNLQFIHAYVDRNLVPIAKPLFRRSTGFDGNVVDQISKANEDYALIIFSPTLLHPFSSGHIRLTSSDPRAQPGIYPNYLSDERDMKNIVRSIGIVEQLIETKSFRTRNATLLHLNLPGCPSFDEDRNDYWRCYTRHMTFPVYHAAGTCALGQVLDERLRVRGVRKLRVADLSVLPHVPSANTAAVTIAIGERAADYVLEDNR